MISMKGVYSSVLSIDLGENEFPHFRIGISMVNHIIGHTDTKRREKEKENSVIGMVSTGKHYAIDPPTPPTL